MWNAALPLPPPPPKPNEGDTTRLPLTHPVSAEDKFRALRASRRAQGLCIRCGAKWSRGHKCAEQVQLHLVQELLDMFPDSADADDSGPSSPTSSQIMMHLSAAATVGKTSPKTFCLTGAIQGRVLSILLDSGSSHTFLSASVAESLDGVQPLSPPVSVQIANGQVLQCHSHIPGGSWSMQGCSFSADLKILPLSPYDMILGIDWLSSFSPMQVHWAQRWLSIPYHGATAVILGDASDLPVGSVIQLSLLSEPSSSATSVAAHPDIAALLSEFSQLFQQPSGLPPSRHCDHSIPLIPGAQPVFVRPYRYAPLLKTEIERQVSEMLHQGLIQHSSSAFASPVLLVKKKDNSWRFCVDYRQLNAITVKSKYPVPIIEELLDELSGASYFTTLDLQAGFHQIRMKEGDEYKTAFQTHFGQFEFRVMSFGLTGAPGTFQGAMNTTVKSCLRQFVLVFFDDILIYSRTWEEHLSHLRTVFELLSKDRWTLKLSKCSFAQTHISYLGHTISSQGVGTDPAKLTAIANWPQPVSVKELRSFLGLAGYYRRFVRHFGLISKPLTTLLKKHTLFIWTPEHTAAFQALKDALCSSPVLALPNFSKPFTIETDASDSGVGAVLMQDGHPLAFFSKALGPRTRGLSTYEKEYMAILLAVQQWRSYLQFQEFIILTDQRSLTQLTDQRLHTHWQQRVFTKLLGLQYRIVYRPGNTNRVADALSRHPEPPATCATVSVLVPTWSSAVIASYRADAMATELLSKLALNPDVVPHFSLHSGLLRYRNRIWVGNDQALKQRLISEFHSSAWAGHSGVPVTYTRLKQCFAWKGMKAAVRLFVQSCVTCQQSKYDRSRAPGLLQPLPVPDSAWHVVSLDFIEGLPTSATYNCVLVVVDLLTKYGHFIPLRHPFTAAGVANAFFHSVYRLHGLPTAIVSDRDRIFTSHFWTELFRLADVKLCRSTAYHPQSDGQTERLNQCLETYLRCYVHACPQKWSRWLTSAEFWYNTCLHSAIGRTPFEALYGYPPRLLAVDPSSAVHPELQIWTTDRQWMDQLLKLHLHRAKNRMKKQADQHRSERSFAVDDLVFLKLQPYVQTSLAPRSHHKLAFRFFGPFRIVARVGNVAYRLALPAHSSIHPVFHVSQLKKAVGPQHEVIPSLPADFAIHLAPEQILQSRMVRRGSDQVQQVLVKWNNLSAELATWEDYEALRQEYPRATAWGQAVFQGEGNVSNSPTAQSGGDDEGRPKSLRPKKANLKYSGREWAN